MNGKDARGIDTNLKYVWFNLHDKQDSELTFFPLRSGEVMLLIADKLGTEDEQAIIVTLNSQQWEALQQQVAEKGAGVAGAAQNCRHRRQITRRLGLL